MHERCAGNAREMDVRCSMPNRPQHFGQPLFNMQPIYSSTINIQPICIQYAINVQSMCKQCANNVQSICSMPHRPQHVGRPFSFRFAGDDPDGGIQGPSRGGDARDHTTAADRNEDRIEVRHLESCETCRRRPQRHERCTGDSVGPRGACRCAQHSSATLNCVHHNQPRQEHMHLLEQFQ